MNKINLKKTAWMTAKVTITAAFLYFAFHNIDLSAFHQDLRQLKWPWLCLAVFQFSIIPLLGGLRWRVVLRSLESAIGTGVSTRLFWIGMAFSQVLPSVSGGDAIRVILAWRSGAPLSLAAHSVILERVAMVLTLISLVVLLQYSAAEHYSAPGTPLIYPLMLLAAIAAVGTLLIADRVLQIAPDWRVCKAVAQLSNDARRVFLKSSSFQLLLLCFTTHINTAVACLWLGNSLDLPLQLPDYIFYISLVTLISTMPLSIGGWGIRESAVVVLFGRIGIAAHGALAFSLLFGATVALISLAGVTGIWMGAQGWSISNLRKEEPLQVAIQSRETN